MCWDLVASPILLLDECVVLDAVLSWISKTDLFRSLLQILWNWHISSKLSCHLYLNMYVPDPSCNMVIIVNYGICKAVFTNPIILLKMLNYDHINKRQCSIVTARCYMQCVIFNKTKLTGTSNYILLIICVKLSCHFWCMVYFGSAVWDRKCL